MIQYWEKAYGVHHESQGILCQGVQLNFHLKAFLFHSITRDSNHPKQSKSLLMKNLFSVTLRINFFLHL